MKSAPFLFLLYCILAASAKDYCAIWQEVKSGDTCWGMIRGKTNLTLDILKQMNKGLDCDKLHVGQKMCMAITGFQLKCQKSHKITTGDTCFEIWTANGLSQQEFMDWNDGLDCDKLQIGKEVCLKRL
ncbi:hypothetical protein B9Z55_016866 [Caenorhabditis nigoni]|uniref:LysM domain-containing protein n=1 Tax=Caenorhabditis nigoni TaxID=1611254 RepID=A0A2G5T6J9_9PELO|nr:hypothetical protein B9Z55_016866 [Caenorhabditis nigoni]